MICTVRKRGRVSVDATMLSGVKVLPKIAVVLVSVQILEAVGEGEAIIEAVKNIVGSSEIRTARNALHPIVIPTEIIEAENFNEEEIMRRLKDSF